ncbi:MAG: hypothetical protein JSW27_06135 [Phycisphaerales bacterium]|nr:MAG: hypothetical protein JSW27_06135 [Phycisphaerales bacterium]
MLRVRIDSREVEVVPVALAQMVLDGTVGRHHLAKTSDGAAERPLEYALDPPHCEALAAELLRRLQSMYEPGGARHDIDLLRTRVETLSQWHWREPDSRARLLWVAAWLNELTGRLDAALEYYDTFLRVRCHESHLRRLAYNNRGVLRIRRGRREGIPDLARAAIAVEEETTGSGRAQGLPAACFNLLNVINVALEVGGLAETVDDELVDFFARLSVDQTERWLGSPTAADARPEISLPAGNSDTEPSAKRSILRDAGYRRLNRLTSNLAAGAMRMVQGHAPESTPEPSEKSSRLLLWSCDIESDEVRRGTGSGSKPCSGYDYACCAEAASLLVADDIPAALLGDEGPGRRVEELAQEELAEIEDLIAAGHHELAQTRLEVQRRVLAALNHRRLASVLKQIDVELKRIAHAKKAREQVQLQRTCGHLVSEVEQFCRVTSLSQAERRLGALNRRLESHRVEGAGEVSRLLDELARRAERHVVQLRCSEIRKRVRAPLRELRENWPADWAVPVPEAAYTALAECHVNDPEGRVEDWAALKDQLDVHQAQYCLRKALAELPSERVSWAEIETILIDALSLAPDLWLTAAPLFGLLAPQNDTGQTQTRADIRTALEAAAGRLLQAAGPQAPGGDHKRQLLRRANALLGNCFRRLRDDGRRFVRLWSCLEQTLVPALAVADEEMIAEIETLARTGQDRWPAGQTQVPNRADPRNPVRMFLESCEQARSLVQAEHLLAQQPPALREARAHVVRALRLGIEGAGQFKRAAAALYLADYSEEDAAPLQRQVLARLDEWAEHGLADTKASAGEKSVVDALVTIRADVLVGRSAPSAEEVETPDRPQA